MGERQSNFFLHINTIYKLGLWKVVYILWYRFTIKTGIRRYWFPVRNIESGKDLFYAGDLRKDYPNEWKYTLIENADKIRIELSFCYYDC